MQLTIKTYKKYGTGLNIKLKLNLKLKILSAYSLVVTVSIMVTSIILVNTATSSSQQSTIEIEIMITKLQKDTKEAGEVMSESQEMTEKNVAQASKAGESLKTITDSTNNIMEMNTLIASAAEEQSAVTEEINKNIVAISKFKT